MTRPPTWSALIWSSRARNTRRVTTEFKPTAYVYTQKMVGLGDSAIGIGEEGSTSLITPSHSVGRIKIDLDYPKSGINDGDILEIERSIEAPDTEGGRRSLWFRVMSVLDSPVTTVIEAVDAVAWLGMQRIRRHYHRRQADENMSDLVQRLIARGGLTNRMNDSTPQELGGELTINPNRHLRSVLLDVSRISKYWLLRTAPGEFAVEVADPTEEIAYHYSDNPRSDEHPIIQPIRRKSLVEPDLAIPTGSWSREPLNLEPQDAMDRLHAWDAATAYTVPGVSNARSIWHYDAQLFNRIRLRRAALTEQILMTLKKNVATLETVAILYLRLYHLVSVTSEHLDYDDEMKQVTLIQETWDQGLLQHDAGLSEPTPISNLLTPWEAAGLSDAVIFSLGVRFEHVQDSYNPGPHSNWTIIVSPPADHPPIPGKFTVSGKPARLLRLLKPNRGQLSIYLEGTALKAENLGVARRYKDGTVRTWNTTGGSAGTPSIDGNRTNVSVDGLFENNGWVTRPEAYVDIAIEDLSNPRTAWDIPAIYV